MYDGSHQYDKNRNQGFYTIRFIGQNIHYNIIKEIFLEALMKRKPNRYGSITKLSGNRSRPYIVKTFNGWKDNGNPDYKTLDYTATYEEAEMLLAKFHNQPWNIELSNMTFKELFEFWKEKKMLKLGVQNRASLCAAYKHCTNLNDYKYKELKAHQMQECIDNSNRGASTQANIKNLFYHLDNFSLELDIINKGYSSLLIAQTAPESTREPFTDDEISLLWKHKNDPIIDIVLIFIYSGWRITEFTNLEIANIDLEQGTMKGGIKTQNGKNRIVPIHSKIRPFIEKYYSKDKIYLCSEKSTPLNVTILRRQWIASLEKLNITGKTPHCARHTFETLLDRYGANKRCRDLMTGHKSKDIGDRVYNHKTIEELKQNIELITI